MRTYRGVVKRRWVLVFASLAIGGAILAANVAADSLNSSGLDENGRDENGCLHSAGQPIVDSCLGANYRTDGSWEEHHRWEAEREAALAADPPPLDLAQQADKALERERQADILHIPGTPVVVQESATDLLPNRLYPQVQRTFKRLKDHPLSETVALGEFTGAGDVQVQQDDGPVSVVVANFKVNEVLGRHGDYGPKPASVVDIEFGDFFAPSGRNYNSAEIDTAFKQLGPVVVFLVSQPPEDIFAGAEYTMPGWKFSYVMAVDGAGNLRLLSHDVEYAAQFTAETPNLVALRTQAALPATAVRDPRKVTQ